MSVIFAVSSESGLRIDEADDWVCVCGNRPDLSGFYSSTTVGVEVEPDKLTWDGIHYTCAECGRVIDGRTGVEVRGPGPFLPLDYQPGDDERREWKVDWYTTIEAEGLQSFPVYGYVILVAADLEEAQAITEDLVDVDFFHPGGGFSASDPRVREGEIFALGFQGRSADHVLPRAVLDRDWNFDEIHIADVQEAVR